MTRPATVAQIALSLMVALRGVVLLLFAALRDRTPATGFLPPPDQWRALIPYLLGEIPVFLTLLWWLRTGSTWAVGVTIVLALASIAQGLMTARKDGVTLLQVDVLLAAVLLTGLALHLFRGQLEL